MTTMSSCKELNLHQLATVNSIYLSNIRRNRRKV